MKLNPRLLLTSLLVASTAMIAGQTARTIDHQEGARKIGSQAAAKDSQQWGIMVGVLEDHPGHYAGDSNYRGVRVVFHKVGQQWLAFPSRSPNQTRFGKLEAITASYPTEVHWTLAFNGRNLGDVAGHTPPSFKFLADVGLQTIPNGSSIPTVGNRSDDYDGFDGGPVYRPLVAVSRPYYKDPDLWKTTPLSLDRKAALRQQFRRQFPALENCDDPNTNTPQVWHYRDEDIAVGKAYSSKNGLSVASALLTNWRCDGPPEDEGAFYSQWYSIEPNGELHFLGAGMRLVDAGDYDNDGRSEILFSVGGYNRAGYKLLYGDLRRSSTFVYTYH